MSYFSLLLLLLLLFGIEAKDARLRGVVMLKPPFIFNGSGPYNGFCIDLINYIAKYVGFDYDLYLSPDGKYGEKNVNGLIGEVYRGSADFAISDLTVTDERRSVVDFTHPFMSFGISALIHKSNLGRVKTLEDLTHQTRVKFTILREGPVFDLVQKSNDPIIEKINRRLTDYLKYSYSYTQALNDVKHREYVLIAESTFNEYIADNDCNYTVINGDQFYQWEYAIALKKESPYLKRFNNALKYLERTGKLNQLRYKYWRSKCLSNSAYVLLNTLLTHTVLLLLLSVFR